jgi:hypothetical protein
MITLANRFRSAVTQDAASPLLDKIDTYRQYLPTARMERLKGHGYSVIIP